MSSTNYCIGRHWCNRSDDVSPEYTMVIYFLELARLSVRSSIRLNSLDADVMTFLENLTVCAKWLISSLA